MFIPLLYHIPSKIEKKDKELWRIQCLILLSPTPLFFLNVDKLLFYIKQLDDFQKNDFYF